MSATTLPPTDRTLLSDEQFARSVAAIKALSMDGVERAKSGHPGMPMGAACMAATLWTEFLVHDSSDANWIDRDRFVLSAGHGSMLLYSLLHLSGYGLTREDLMSFRQWESRTPGHPEYRHTRGVEVTTGPLGSGFATGVGLALAERFLASTFNRPDFEVINHFTYGIVSDGDLMEGLAAEAASLAGHQRLGKLIYLYDDNLISIDGGTELTFTEDVAARFAAYGWHTIRVDGHDRDAIRQAIKLAREEASRPSLILCRTVIGHGAPTKQGTSATHGSPLGAAEIERAKAGMSWNHAPFEVPQDVSADWDAISDYGHARRDAHQELMGLYRAEHPALAAALDTLYAGELPEGVLESIPSFAPGTSISTRKASNQVLDALTRSHPTLLGGSADLAGSNGCVLPKLSAMQANSPAGRTIHFGVREHAMAAICNGLALHGGIRPFGATFLVFSDFMRGALRLSALMKIPVIQLFSHDSFWLGEDGPTHQPIEHTMSLRMIPDLWVIRPADARETAAAWRLAMERVGPTAILLSRQDLPVLAGTREDIREGAYVVFETPGCTAENLQGILIATGSEVALAVQSADELHAKHGQHLRVVSMPCWEAFEALDRGERDLVLPPSVSKRLSIEAGVTLGWQKWASQQHGLDHFGASAPAEKLAAEFGFSVEAVVSHWLSLE